MTLKEKLQADLNEAIKGRNEEKTSVLRMVKAAILKFEVSGSEKKSAGDEEILNILTKELKQRKESVEAFRKGGREDLAKKEEAEVAILAAYLPQQMTEDEVRVLAKQAITQVGAQSKKELGKVMAILMPQVKGKADGQMVSKVAGELLN